MSKLKKKIINLRIKVSQVKYDSSINKLPESEKNSILHNINIAINALSSASNSIY